MQDPNFRAICEDYAEALRARQHWQKADDSAHQRAQEYGRFVAELEEEALAVLRATVTPSPRQQIAKLAERGTRFAPVWHGQ